MHVTINFQYCLCFYEGTCDLLTKESLQISDPLLMINSSRSRNPPVVGDSITFYCSSGELIGLNKTTCQQGGNWEPDPSKVRCTIVPIRCKLHIKNCIALTLSLYFPVDYIYS